MKRPKRLKRTHISTPIVLPNHWSAKQATAVFEILDDGLPVGAIRHANPQRDAQRSKRPLPHRHG